MLNIVEIHKTYQIGPTEIKVLRGITLTVEKGEMLAIIGPSGSGKSTLMNMIGLLEQPTSGSYFIEGKKISYDNDRELSKIRNQKIGFVFQSYHLLPRLTAMDNVGIPLVYRDMKEKEIKERAKEYLKKVEVEDRAQHKPNELSGGQQQRVAIARALIGDPALVLADEPTGALDSRTGQEIMSLFKRLNEEEDITIIIITHDPKIALQCKRKVELKDGVIVG
ncbi:MAG: ABC transporter ATP-binding protein [Deltaproteobacteria bacterium]|nr:ABC transporter ATP-binding protein [Deltaproteobacteria bacterium]